MHWKVSLELCGRLVFIGDTTGWARADGFGLLNVCVPQFLGKLGFLWFFLLRSPSPRCVLAIS